MQAKINLSVNQKLISLRKSSSANKPQNIVISTQNKKILMFSF